MQREPHACTKDNEFLTNEIGQACSVLVELVSPQVSGMARQSYLLVAALENHTLAYVSGHRAVDPAACLGYVRTYRDRFSPHCGSKSITA